jgi:hypothetical protein
MPRNSLYLPGILGLLLVIASTISCEKEEDPEEFDCSESVTHYLEITPENPTSLDIILAIDSICGNETDVLLDIQDQEITFTRYTNSLMMMPCRPRADTTVIGRLNPGQYRLVHMLIDKNHLLQDSIVLQDTLCLSVN